MGRGNSRRHEKVTLKVPVAPPFVFALLACAVWYSSVNTVVLLGVLEYSVEQRAAQVVQEPPSSSSRHIYTTQASLSAPSLRYVVPIGNVYCGTGAKLRAYSFYVVQYRATYCPTRPSVS
jgi:hypothetical protein